MKQAICVLSVFALFSACTMNSSPPSGHKGRSPDEVVKSFIDLSTTSKDVGDRRKLQDLCIGEIKRTLERMNDEAFRLIYLDTKVSVIEFKVIESTTDGETARVHYQVTIDNKQGTDPTREVNQREVELTRSQGAWFIESIKTKGSDQVAFTRGMLF